MRVNIEIDSESVAELVRRLSGEELKSLFDGVSASEIIGSVISPEKALNAIADDICLIDLANRRGIEDWLNAIDIKEVIAYAVNHMEMDDFLESCSRYGKKIDIFERLIHEIPCGTIARKLKEMDYGFVNVIIGDVRPERIDATDISEEQAEQLLNAPEVQKALMRRLLKA